MIAYPGRTFGQLYHRFVKGNALAHGPVRLGDRTIDLSAITVPVLVFAGATDGIAPVKCGQGRRTPADRLARGAVRDRPRRPPRHADRPRRPRDDLADHRRDRRRWATSCAPSWQRADATSPVRRAGPARVPASAGRGARADRRAGPLPEPRPPGRALSFSVPREVRPLPQSLTNIYAELADRPGHHSRLPRRPLGVGRPWRHAAQPRPDGRAGPLQQPQGQGLGSGDGARDSDPRRSEADPSWRSCGATTHGGSVRGWPTCPPSSRRTRRPCRPTAGSSGRSRSAPTNALLAEAGRASGRLAAARPTPARLTRKLTVIGRQSTR
jgi:hypothetical protein